MNYFSENINAKTNRVFNAKWVKVTGWVHRMFLRTPIKIRELSYQALSVIDQK